MKKQLLFTLAFVASIFVASAQSNTFTFTGSSSESTTFSFGSTAGIYALSGSDFSQGASFIGYNSEVESGSSVSESFGIDTDSGSTERTLTFTYRKRAAMTGVLRISAPGQADVIYNLEDTSAEDGSNNALVERTLEYPYVLNLSPVATNITFTVDELAQNGVNNVRLRIYDVTVNGTLSTQDFNRTELTVKVYPNTVQNSFQIDSNNSIEQVALYNITGQLIRTYGEEVNYNINDLSSGIYLVNIKTALGSKTLRIIKK
ncbi:T9SS type A sorting domain-containing protein [Winogradskyella arenosi]|uniref:Putative secreted protein (Por secretion system target) n=1 Tax=Winogradskyella arenosi TaxID=533325 RepID=A0A368ZFB1_9FLAO|nr:T9SS type A sorting domain-containing protein [Winogradskyella arenosi]RCW92123.1 putative secreted protein (Por secretion system target) [Winogradskyella arenosi]